nr:hypothetical protein [Prevotella sp.]
IGIKYKKDVEFQKLDETSAIGRAIRKMNINLADCQEAIPANGLTMQTKELCDLLNARLKK